MNIDYADFTVPPYLHPFSGLPQRALESTETNKAQPCAPPRPPPASSHIRVEDDPVGAVNELCCHDDVIVATGDREIAVIEVRNPIIRGHIAGT